MSVFLGSVEFYQIIPIPPWEASQRVLSSRLRFSRSAGKFRESRMRSPMVF